MSKSSLLAVAPLEVMLLLVLQEKGLMSLYLRLQSFHGMLLLHTPFDKSSFSLTFRRYHVGESLIPSVRHYLRFIGAEEKLANYGFVHKVHVYIFSVSSDER